MSEWISVKDRLPESNREVLAVDVCGDMWVGPLAIDETGDVVCLTPDEASNITYWMPLPNPPTSTERTCETCGTWCDSPPLTASPGS